MKKRRFLFTIIAVALLIGISALLLVQGSNKTLEEVEINDNELDSWNKINTVLKEKTPNSYYFKNKDLYNGDILLLQGKKGGLELKGGNHVQIDLTMVPDGISHTGIGYILDGNYTEVFSEPVSNKLTTSFDVEVDGEYIICIIGANANFLTVTEGVVSIE